MVLVRATDLTIGDPPRGVWRARCALWAHVLAWSLLLLGCNRESAARPSPGPVEVGVVTVQAEPVTLYRELPGRTSPFRVAEVRARVDGIVLERLFEEGSDVEEGQLLYRIDPKPYEAALASAKASLSRARASVQSSKLLAERYKGLLKDRAVSQQEHDNAAAAYQAALADVAAGQAAVQAAEIDLGYTRVTSPIAGRIGRAEVTEGAYAQRAQATLLATVQQLDPMYVDLTQASAEVLRLRAQWESGALVPSGDGAKVQLVLEDGTIYGEEGVLQFSDVTVNPTTGSITLRALFPNPNKKLLPGMFVRARLEEGTQPEALLVPQRALRRDAQGRATVWIVGAGDKVEVRQVQAPRAIGDKWLITEGLAPGDRVIVDGLQKVRPGSEITIAPGAQAAR